MKHKYLDPEILAIDKEKWHKVCMQRAKGTWIRGLSRLVINRFFNRELHDLVFL